MTEEKKSPPYLRPVTVHVGHAPLSAEQLGPTAWQRSLFISSNAALLVFAHVAALSEAEFIELLTEARAKYVIDLRPVPRFDVGSLTRRRVFAIFDGISSKYIDLSGRLGVTDRRDSKLNPKLLTEHLLSVVKPTQQSLLDGPIIFLVDTPQFDANYVDGLSSSLQALRPSGWELLRVPEKRQGAADRSTRTDKHGSLIFVSHANPEDSEFVKWLGIQLTLAGYQIWSDVTKLIGGETFWDSIEDAIRHHSAKVIVVVSRSSQQKNGVLDEINLAVSIERASGKDDFVLPIRLDSIPFDEVRANISRKNIVDFSTNWATGLAAVLTILDRDNVPRIGVNADSVAAWSRKLSHKAHDVIRVSEHLSSNWLDIHRIPDHIELVARNTNAAPITVMPTESSPTAVFSGYTALLRKLPLGSDREACILNVAEGLRHGVDSPCQLSSRQASNLITSLLRQSWAQYASSKGLLAYTLSSGTVAWYAPTGLVEGDNVAFRTHSGKPRRKYLVGRSDKRNVYWHFALEARPTLARRSRIALVSHVAFTIDGKSDLVSQARAHSLRRQFCKNWWNDRWRDLTMAYLTWFFDGKNDINLPTEQFIGFGISTQPIEFRSPVSVTQLSRDDRIEEAVEELEWEDLDVLEAIGQDGGEEVDFLDEHE